MTKKTDESRAKTHSMQIDLTDDERREIEALKGRLIEQGRLEPRCPTKKAVKYILRLGVKAALQP